MGAVWARHAMCESALRIATQRTYPVLRKRLQLFVNHSAKSVFMKELATIIIIPNFCGLVFCIASDVTATTICSFLSLAHIV